MNEDFNKYLAIANHDIQMANNMSELKSYVASILYDNDKKVEIINKQNSIIKEVREKLIKYGLVDKDNNFNAYLDTIELKELLEILDKEKEI